MRRRERRKQRRLQDLSLGAKLWLAFLLFLIPCTVGPGLCFRQVLGYTRDEEIFNSITDAQKLLGSGKSAGTPAYDAAISVYHIGIVNHQVKYLTFPQERYGVLLTPLIEQMGTSFAAQTGEEHRYKYSTSGYALYYVIRKNGNDGVISFKLDVPMDGVYRTAYLVLALLTASAVVLAAVLSFLLLRSMMKPLRRLERSLSDMAAGDLDTPVVLGRGDEIGRLSAEADTMRRALAARDVMRQSALQFVSHKLKTPIMTIASYAQALLDHVYPRGTPEGSAQVILDESQRMQRLVMQLLTMTRLDYLETRPGAPERLDAGKLCAYIAERACGVRPGLKVHLGFEPVELVTYRDRLEVLAENLLENAVRHAASTLEAGLRRRGSTVELTVYNDGGGIDEALLPRIFEAYTKGSGGVSGLGLAIVRRAAQALGGAVAVRNERDGVLFTVTLPVQGVVPPASGQRPAG